MKHALASITLSALSAPCAAQWGLFGFTGDGDLHHIDRSTGARTFVGSTGLDVVAASDTGSLLIAVTNDGRLHTIDRVFARSVDSRAITGLPAGHRVTAMASNNGLFAAVRTIVTSPQGEQHLYEVSLSTGAATRRGGPFAVSDIGAIGGYYGLHIITRDGQIYELNHQTLALTYQTTLWPAGGPYIGITSLCEHWGIAIGSGYWTLTQTEPWTPVHHTGYEDLVGIAMFNAFAYADCDYTWYGLDIFDFLCWGYEFGQRNPYACDCDVSTGLGVCDVFDYICYLNAWAESCMPER